MPANCANRAPNRTLNPLFKRTSIVSLDDCAPQSRPRKIYLERLQEEGFHWAVGIEGLGRIEAGNRQGFNKASFSTGLCEGKLVGYSIWANIDVVRLVREWNAANGSQAYSLINNNCQHFARWAMLLIVGLDADIPPLTEDKINLETIGVGLASIFKEMPPASTMLQCLVQGPNGWATGADMIEDAAFKGLKSLAQHLTEDTEYNQFRSDFGQLTYQQRLMRMNSC